MTDISVTRCNQKTFNLTFTDGNGDPLDITGATITSTVKRSLTDTEPLFTPVVVTSHDNAAGGLSSVTFTEANMTQDYGKYYYDIQITGGGLPRSTVEKGILEITWKTTED